jgi:hypothetical protein
VGREVLNLWHKAKLLQINRVFCCAFLFFRASAKYTLKILSTVEILHNCLVLPNTLEKGIFELF